nr:hypothetical protein [Candidatus Accumulibacter sp. ACC003]
MLRQRASLGRVAQADRNRRLAQPVERHGAQLCPTDAAGTIDRLDFATAVAQINRQTEVFSKQRAATEHVMGAGVGVEDDARIIKHNDAVRHRRKQTENGALVER